MVLVQYDHLLETDDQILASVVIIQSKRAQAGVLVSFLPYSAALSILGSCVAKWKPYDGTTMKMHKGFIEGDGECKG